MMRAMMCGLVLIASGAARATQQDGPILLEVPLMVQAPGVHFVVRAYHDGERFLVDVDPLLRRLGYTVTASGMQLVAEDALQRLTFDFLTLKATRSDRTSVSLTRHAYQSEGRYLVDVMQLQQLFAADVYFDPERLSLQLSSAAEHFDVLSLGPRSLAASEVPGPLRFGRTRQLLGGMLASWRLSTHRYENQQHYADAQVDMAISILHGTVRGTLSGTPEGTYMFDRPGSSWLTRLEIGRMPTYGGRLVSGLRVSNVPLAALALQHTTTVEGSAPAHAMAETRVAGQIMDRTRVDAAGRYRLRIPVRYGSTEAVVRIQPLGGVPGIERRHYALAVPELMPARRFHYDALLSHGGRIQAHYGVSPDLTFRLELRHRGAVQARAVLRPLPFLIVSTDAAYPLRLAGARVHLSDYSSRPSSRSRLRLAGARVHLWRRNVSADASMRSEQGVTQGHLSVSAQWRTLGGQLTGTMSRFLSGPEGVRVTPALYWAAPGHYVARVNVTYARYGNLPSVIWRTSAGKTIGTGRSSATHFEVFAHGDGAIRSGGLSARYASGHLSLGLRAAYEPDARRLTAQLTLQWRTSALALTSRLSTRGNHSHSAQGSVSLGRRLGFSRAARDETAALLRPFEDLNGNGRYEEHEPILSKVDIQVFQAPVQRMDDGTLRAMYLEPYATYQLRILEHSIADPWLRPVTGYTFSFVADPGHTKVIDIALQRVPLVRGRVASARRPSARLRVEVFSGDIPVGSAEVFRDGGFALRLPPGAYVLQLKDVVDDTVLMRHALEVPANSRVLDLNLR